MFQESYMRKMAALVGVMMVIALAAYTYFTLKQAKYIYSGPTSINISGKGEVFAVPDIASFTFSIEAKEPDATSAQDKVSEKMNTILSYFKEMGIEEKDIKTEYFNLSPYYEYPTTVCTPWSCPPQGEPKLIGYQVNQTVTAKVRDTKKAGEVITGVGERGAMNVSGIVFTIDDEEKLMTEAREKAIKDAQDKAEVLAKNLGVRIVRMNGYWEEQGGGYPVPYGMGGDMSFAKEDSASAMRPAELPLGENTITSVVNISYEIQ